MGILQAGQPTPPLPGGYVTIIPPAQNYLSPAETDIIGLVGTATWGPVDLPTQIGSPANFQGLFGNLQARKYDMGTHVATAVLQGAQNFVCVRVTDGTDVAASALLGLRGTASMSAPGSGYVVADVLTLSNGATIRVSTVSSGAIATFTQVTQPTAATAGTITQVSTTGVGTGATFTYTYVNGATATSLYTGSGANADTVTVSAGRQAGSYSVVVYHPGLPTETFQNVGPGLTGAAAWAAIVAAVNNGAPNRPASKIVVLTVGTSTFSPPNTSTTVTMAGGVDGVTSITGTILVGTDVSPRTGMYALRKQRCSVGALADCDSSATWTTQLAFALSEGIYMIGCGPRNDTISNAVSTIASVGLSTATSWAFKYLHGDWCYFLDSFNAQTRVVSPQGFVAGWIAANGPQFSTLNKPLLGIVGSQTSVAGVVYYDDDLVTLELAGIDLIMNPAPGGNYFACRFGHNSSSNPLVQGDNYPRMTNFIAATINQGIGPYIGDLQLPSVQREAKAALDTYFDDLWKQEVIGTPDPTLIPWLVTLDGTNNPQNRVALGIMQADVLVIFQSVIEKFLVNVQGGQSVTISRVSTTPVSV